ncbi:hypothetical protein VI817_005998 [Penicillium citrinum]|nr:hypothetical protein VI817_005998 [Penicillium citrinum]
MAHNSMDSYLRAFGKDFSEEFVYGFSSAKPDNDRNKSWKYKNSTGRHIYNHKIEFPFRLLSPEIAKKVVVITYRDTEAEYFLKASLSDALLEFMSGKPIHLSRISHGMCSVQLQTSCGSDDRLSAGELSVLAWQIKNAIFAEMELCQRLFPDEVLKLKKLDYPRLAIIYDVSGKVRVLYAYLVDKLYIQASKILDFGWLAVKQPVGTNPVEEDFDTKRYLNMMGILLRWMWPITKEKPTRETEDLALDWPW